MSCAIILAAGMGSRLLPLTEQCPKALIPVGKKSIIDYQIDAYLHAGINEENIYVVTGYLMNQMAEHLNDVFPLLNIVRNSEYKTTNNMYSLKLALDYIKEINAPYKQFYINNGDCIYSKDIILKFVSDKVKNAVCVEFGAFIDESMKVVCNNNMQLVDISKKICSEQAFGVSIDLYKYDVNTIGVLHDIINRFILVENNITQWTEVAFPLLFKQVKVHPIACNGQPWIEIDNHDDLLSAQNMFK